MNGIVHEKVIRHTKDMAQVQKDQLQVYLITDPLLREHQLEAVEAALKGGVMDLQLREKNLPPADLFALALALRRLTEKYGARLYINGRLDIALLVDADGVHLPEDGLPPNAVKVRYPHLWVGVSTHSLASAKQAEKDGADFVTFSPIFETPSKQQYGPPQGLDKLGEVCTAVNIPVLALGGINLERTPTVQKCGAHGVALIRGIWNSSNIEQTASQYIAVLKGEPL